jgi:chorismate mutase
MPAAKTSLDDLRREIDRVDDAIHDLLMRRTEIVKELRVVKGGGGAPIRPGREAQVLRRLIARHRGPFPKPVIARMWRDIIAALTELQGPLAVAVHAPEGGPDLRRRARDHYGTLTPITSYESELGVLRAVTDGRATIGVLPLPQSDDDDPWWRSLASDKRETPRIIARLPFVSMEPSPGDGVEGLAVAMAPHEESGLDRSFLVVETAEQVSRDALTHLLTTAGIRVLDIKHWEDQPEQRLHLIEVEDFLAAGDKRLAELERDGEELKSWVVGGYAVPLSAEELAPSGEQETV